MIIVVPNNTLTDSQKDKLAEKNYVVLECDDPDKIRVINPESLFEVNDFFMAALNALTVGTATSKTEYFVNNLYKRLKAKEDKNETNTPQP